MEIVRLNQPVAGTFRARLFAPRKEGHGLELWPTYADLDYSSGPPAFEGRAVRGKDTPAYMRWLANSCPEAKWMRDLAAKLGVENLVPRLDRSSPYAGDKRVLWHTVTLERRVVLMRPHAKLAVVTYAAKADSHDPQACDECAQARKYREKAIADIREQATMLRDKYAKIPGATQVAAYLESAAERYGALTANEHKALDTIRRRMLIKVDERTITFILREVLGS